MASKLLLVLTVASCCACLALCRNYLKIVSSGNEEVAKYATVLKLYVEVGNKAKRTQNVTVSPEQCCLFIDTDDVECEVMELRPPVMISLNPKQRENASFLFRNLYARYRQGNCTFKLSSTYRRQRQRTHTLYFNTFPEDAKTCFGIDQDMDRNCSQADCAIKYKGKRNFYRNSTGKCEPVVECNTRGTDGITVTGYYDWENNFCHHLDWVKENSLTHVESDTEIPSEIDPSQTQYIPIFEPAKIEALNGGEKLECNNGYQDGIYCVCNKGWMSSGIHQNNPLVFHWCDTRKIDPLDIHYGPRRLTKPQEISAVLGLILGNFIMSATWFYCSYKLCCKKQCTKLRRRQLYKYTRLPRK